MKHIHYCAFYMSSGLPSQSFETFNEALDEAERNCAPGETAIILRLVHQEGKTYVTKDFIFTAIDSDKFF